MEWVQSVSQSGSQSVTEKGWVVSCCSCRSFRSPALALLSFAQALSVDDERTNDCFWWKGESRKRKESVVYSSTPSADPNGLWTHHRSQTKQQGPQDSRFSVLGLSFLAHPSSISQVLSMQATEKMPKLYLGRIIVPICILLQYIVHPIDPR